MGKVGGPVEDEVWDRASLPAGVAMKAEGAVVWLATSKQRSMLPSTIPAANINYHMYTRQKKPLINHRTIEYVQLEGIYHDHQVQLLEPTK